MQQLTGTGINIILSIIIIVYLIKIDNCSCVSKIKNEKQYLKEWFMFMIIWMIINAFYFFSHFKNYHKTIKINSHFNFFINLPLPLLMINMIINIIHLFILTKTLIYIKNLKEIGCDCELIRYQDLVYYTIIAWFSISLLFILLLIIGIIINVYYYSYKNKK
jgi:hypothetical protein